MRPTSGMYHSLPTDLVVRGVPVSVENTFELSQEPLRSLTSTTQAEVEHDRSSGATVLPEIRLVVLSLALACLYIDWGFIRLNVAPADQLSPHCRHHRDQQFAYSQNPAVQRRSADFQANISFQDHALPMQRYVIAIFADDRARRNTDVRLRSLP